MPVAQGGVRGVWGGVAEGWGDRAFFFFFFAHMVGGGCEGKGQTRSEAKTTGATHKSVIM